MVEVVDAAQRARALDPRTSFAVTAPAGSGKTELLIQRSLTLLASVEKPEEILAITFTRKAANEMRSRILAALQDAQSDQEPEESHKRNTWKLARAVLAQDDSFAWNLLDNPNRLRIQTIDSFCMHLVQRMPLLSKLGAEARISDNPLAQYQAAARSLLARLEEGTAISEDLQRLLRHLDNNTARIEELLCAILSKREQWLRHFTMARHADFDFRHYLQNCLHERVMEVLEDCSACLQPFESQLMLCVDFACSQLQQSAPDAELLVCSGLTELPECSAAALLQWQALADLLLTKDGRFRASLTKNQGFPSSSKKDEKEAFKAAKQQCLDLIEALAECPDSLEKLQEVRSLPAPEYADRQWQLLDTLTRLLPNLVAELTLVFMEQGQLDYAQVSSAAAQALGDDDSPTDIALLLDYQLKHILVDEFQDTSSPQFNLLRRLTEGWEPGDGRTLFIVGDGMQSCYGFREANVGLFLAAREFGIGNASLEALDLRANFRSDAGVVNWVNESFAAAFPAEDNIARGAVTYSPSVPVHACSQSEPVQFFACIEEQSRELEARKVVELVEEISQSHPQDSIAILVRNRPHLRDIIPALRDAGIDWQAVDIDPLAKRPLISDLIALTRAMLNPADRIAWLSILRAPWCGLSLDDLHRLSSLPASDGKTKTTLWRQLNHKNLLESLSEPGQLAITRFLAALKPAIQQRQRKPLRQWIEGLWLALGGHLTASSSQELNQVPAFFELMTQHEQGGTITDVTAFNEAVSGLFAKPASNPEIRLQIMTIHKSKGLEFDHVILPGLDRGSASRNQELLLWHEQLSRSGNPLLLMGSLPEKGTASDPLYEYLKREHRLKERLENSRLLYVGATRAVKQLRLLATLTHREGTDELKAPSENSLLHSIWPQIKDQAIPVDNLASRQASSAPRKNLINRLSPTWQPRNPVRGDLLAAFRGHEYAGDNLLYPVFEAGLEEQEARIADCFHNALLAICQRGSEYWQAANDESLQALAEEQLRLSGFYNETVARQALVNGLRRALADTSGQWLLSGRHPLARTKWQLNQHISTGGINDTIQYAIDRSFVADGKHWLVSFECLISPGDTEEMRQKQQHLQAAAGALSQLTELPVKPAIYYAGTEMPCLIELS